MFVSCSRDKGWSRISPFRWGEKMEKENQANIHVFLSYGCLFNRKAGSILVTWMEKKVYQAHLEKNLLSSTPSITFYQHQAYLSTALKASNFVFNFRNQNQHKAPALLHTPTALLWSACNCRLYVQARHTKPPLHSYHGLSCLWPRIQPVSAGSVQELHERIPLKKKELTSDWGHTNDGSSSTISVWMCVRD